MNTCLKQLLQPAQGVQVCVTKASHRAHYKNIIQCGSVWTCPVCAAKITLYRKKRTVEAINKKKFGKAAAIFTIQHNRGSDLETLVKDLFEGVSFVTSGPPARRFRDKWLILGTITSPEYTFSLENGHHPHKNLMFISAYPQSKLDCEEFRSDLARLQQRYKDQLAKKGYLVNEHTVYNFTKKDDVESYFLKWGLEAEVIQGEQKQGHENHYTPFQLLDVIGDNKISEIDRQAYTTAFREYAQCFKGKRQVCISRELQVWLELDDQEITDQEIVENEEEPSYLFASLEWGQWKKLLYYERRGNWESC